MPKRVGTQDEARALQNQLFGWRSFLIARVVMEPGVDRLTFSNVTDLKVNMLLREAERKNLFYCISGENAVSIQRSPFFVPSPVPSENEIVRMVQKCGSCVTETGAVQSLDASLLLSPSLCRLQIGKVKFVQLAGEISVVENTKVIDSLSSKDAEQG